MSDCVECDRLTEESSMAYAEYVVRKDELAMTRKTDREFVAKRKAFDRAEGRVSECHKRWIQHRSDVHSGRNTTPDIRDIETKLLRLRECINSGDSEGVQEAIFELGAGSSWKKVPDEVVEGLLALLRNEKMFESPMAGQILNYFEFESPRLTSHQKWLCIGFLDAHGDRFVDAHSSQVVTELRYDDYLK